MIAVVQYVSHASVTVDGAEHAAIQDGYVIFLGICTNDTVADIHKVVNKIVTMRIIPDKQGKMNRSLPDSRGEILLISQFTLCADLSAGRRPSFTQAKKSGEAEKLYLLCASELQKKGLTVKSGVFGAHMLISLLNSGPITFIIDSIEL